MVTSGHTTVRIGPQSGATIGVIHHFTAIHSHRGALVLYGIFISASWALYMFHPAVRYVDRGHSPSLGQRRVEEGGSAGHLQFAPALRVVWAFWTMTGDLKGPLSSTRPANGT